MPSQSSVIQRFHQKLSDVTSVSRRAGTPSITWPRSRLKPENQDRLRDQRADRSELECILPFGGQQGAAGRARQSRHLHIRRRRHEREVEKNGPPHQSDSKTDSQTARGDTKACYYLIKEIDALEAFEKFDFRRLCYDLHALDLDVLQAQFRRQDRIIEKRERDNCRKNFKEAPGTRSNNTDTADRRGSQSLLARRGPNEKEKTKGADGKTTECNSSDSKTHFIRNCPLPGKFDRAKAKRKALFHLRHSKRRADRLSSFFTKQTEADYFDDIEGGDRGESAGESDADSGESAQSTLPKMTKNAKHSRLT